MGRREYMFKPTIWAQYFTRFGVTRLSTMTGSSVSSMDVGQQRGRIALSEAAENG
jgi:hypothetical protein